MLATQLLEHGWFRSQSLAVAVFLPEVTKPAPRTVTPLPVIPVAAQKPLAVTVPVRCAQGGVPSAGSLRTCVPQTLTTSSLPAWRPDSDRGGEHTIFVSGRRDVDYVGDPQVATIERVNSIRPEDC